MPIVTEDLTKIYGRIVAVDHVSINIPDGIVFGLLGPNGAGKTTLVRILTTLSRPTQGKAYVDGLDVSARGLDIRKLIGVVAQENYLDSYLTARENLVTHAKMHGMNPREYNPRIDELLEMVGLSGRQNDSPKNYSGGMRRRLVLVRALVSNPKIIFLDEPTTGLDPQSRRLVWDHVNSVRGKVTVFLTTHYMEEADTLCDRVAVMDLGRILVDDSPEALKRSFSRQSSYEVEVRGSAQDYVDSLRTMPFVQSVAAGNGRLVVQLTPKGGPKELLAQFREEDIVSFCLRQPSLEDVFIGLTGKGLRD